MDRITSPQNGRIKETAKLLDNKGDRFLVEGFHLVEMALDAKMALEVFSIDDFKASVPVTLVSEDVIKKLSFTKSPEGIVAVCAKPSQKPLSSSRLLVLDAVQDPGNVGTLLRTALSFGFTDVILGEGSSDVYNSKALLASQGAIFKLNIIQGAKLPESLPALKKQGYEIVATDLRTDYVLSSLPRETKMALILGNEARGVDPKALALSDYRLRLEMSGIDSLNVAVAGGILMYELKA
jgi:TrmH family RNA methyltransferase